MASKYVTFGNIQQLVAKIKAGFAAIGHKHAAGDITSGVLSTDRLPTTPVAKGGTGANDAAGARTNLGITPGNIGAATANHTHGTMKGATTSAAGAAGMVPAPAQGNNNRYLRSDGQWQVPPDTNTTYGNMRGASTTADGGSGLVPAPAKGNNNRYLRSDGTWQVPPDTNTTYGNMRGASTTADGGSGLVPAPSQGAANRYLRSDGQWATPPDTNTTYGVATQSANGLMSAADKKKLDNVQLSSWPIGAIMLTATNTNPATSIGGTWQQLTATGFTGYLWQRTA